MFPVCVRVHVANSANAASERYVTIDFNDVDISLFIKYVSEITGKNFIVDRAVQGKINLLSPTQIPESQVYAVFESVLEVHGFTTVPAGSVIKILPSAQARTKSIALLRDGDSFLPEDKVVTRIIPLAHSSAKELKGLLTPLVSKESVLIANEQAGMLILTDTQSNILRLEEIIYTIDIPSVAEQTEVVPLQHGSASTMAKSLTQLFTTRNQSGKKGAGQASTMKIMAYERTNTLVLVASPEQLVKIKSMIERLDVPLPHGTGNIRVYYLQHASAEELVKVLTSLPEQNKITKKGAQTSPLLQDVRILADVETNSLVITASREEYLVLEEVIKKLDIPRRMVYMEALIMEVQVSKNFKVGVEWAIGGSFDDGTGSLIGGFSPNESDPFNLLSGDDVNLGSGITLGILKQGIEIGGVYFPNLGAVINAYKKDDDINIIATPQILTTDNKEASIKVGENVPYITSQNTSSSGNNQDYTNYEYKDVATSLTILPQINHADVVRLDIGVEVIKLKDSNDFRPTTFTRTASTTVVVHDQETVVIGGMIGQDITTAQYKVPILGDIPFLGPLFGSNSESEDRTNLFIFITPHIVENPAEMAGIYYKKQDIMESVQTGSSDIPHKFFHRKANPDYAPQMLDLGFAALQKSDLNKAGQYFSQALKLDPKNAYARLNLGTVLFRQGRQEEARVQFKQAINFASDGSEHEVNPEVIEVAKEYIQVMESSTGFSFD